MIGFLGTRMLRAVVSCLSPPLGLGWPVSSHGSGQCGFPLYWSRCQFGSVLIGWGIIVLLVGSLGLPGISTYRAGARFKVGGRRLGEVRYAAGITGGIVGRKGTHTAVSLDADIPASLRKGASESLCRGGGPINYPESRGGKSPEGGRDGALCHQFRLRR